MGLESARDRDSEAVLRHGAVGGPAVGQAAPAASVVATRDRRSSRPPRPTLCWLRRLGTVLQTRSSTAVALVALACRLALALPALGEVQRFYIAPDSFEYDQLARNLLQGHGYSQSVAPPYLPDVRRTPIYPLLLAAVYATVGYVPRAAVATNLLLGVLACVLTAALGRRLFGRGAGMLAGLFLAIDLTSAAYSLTLMAETLFTVLLLLCALSTVRCRSEGGTWPVVGAAVSCGLAILARPIGIFLPILVGPALVLLRQASSRRARLLSGCAFMVVALAFPVGWTIRNYRAAGVTQLTSLVAINAYYHRAAQVEAARRGISVELTRRELAAQPQARGEPAPSERPADLDAMERRALEVVLAHPASYLALHLQGVARMLGPDREAWVQLQTSGPPAAGPPLDVAEFVSTDSHPHRATGGLGVFLALLQVLALYTLALVGALAGLRRTARRGVIAFLTIFPLYFLALSGPEAYARFRVPMMPFVVLLAAGGAQGLWRLPATATLVERVPARPRRL